MRIELSYFTSSDSEDDETTKAADSEQEEDEDPHTTGESARNGSPVSDYNLQIQRSMALEKLTTELFSNISHEFKTPINIIMSSIDLLKLKLQMDDPKNYEEKYAQYLHYTEQNCYKLLRLVSNLLDSTKMENRSLQLLTSKCDIKTFIQNTLRCTETFAQNYGIEIYYTSEIEGPCMLNCDRDRVDRILLNLLSNSIKHTPQGGQIFVNLSDDEDYVYISVRDTGEGIQPEFLPYVFDKFQTCSESFIKNSDGTGLGLSIVKGLVELHQGIITVNSTPGEGATFTFSLSKHLPHSMSSTVTQYTADDEAMHRSMSMTEIGYFDKP